MARRMIGIGDGTGLALLLAAVGVVLILQGWQSRIPNFGVLTTIDAAQEFIDHHRLPEKGAITSFGSFTPPGAMWLMLPGLLIFRDPRLFECVGSLSLYVGTFLGIFFLARRCFGRDSALVAALLYGFSELGLTAGSSLFQRYPIQFFLVWVVYFVVRWVDDNDGRWLAAATLTWAAGMNVHMELAPVILAVPVVWFAWRPAVRLVPLLVVAAAATILWYPHLRFERDRHFMDLRSQVLRESMRPTDFPDSWCDPSRVPARWLEDAARDRAGEAAARSAWSPRQWVSGRVAVVAQFWSVNFTQSRAPGARFGLFLLTCLGIGASLIGTRKSGVAPERQQEARSRAWLKWLAVGLAILGVAFNEFTLARWISADGVLASSSIGTIRAAQIGLLLTALLAALFRNAASAGWVYARRVLTQPSWQAKVFGTCLVVSWVCLLLVASQERRFLQLWPLQVIALSAAVVSVPRQFRLPRPARWLAAAAVCVIVLSNDVLLSRVNSWRHEGFTGRGAPEIGVVDVIAQRMQVKGQPAEVSIGYQVDFWRFMADANRIDSLYKVGADLDVLLKYRHGITNLDRCAEGFRPGDDYRVVQVTRLPTADSHSLNRLSPAGEREGAFAIMERVDQYEVLER